MEWLEDVIVENKIVMRGKSLLLCLRGIVAMENKIDPLHNRGHVARMIKDALILVKTEEIKTDWSVLLMAICWHDVWTAKNVPKNIFGFMREYVWDGFGSAIMFDREAGKFGLDEEMAKKVEEAIKKHPTLHMGKHETVEEKILWDVDNLETWSWKRVKPLEKELIREKRGRKKNRQVRLAKFYFDNFMKKRNGKNLYFAWSRMEFEKRKKMYMKKTEKLRGKYGISSR